MTSQNINMECRCVVRGDRCEYLSAVREAIQTRELGVISKNGIKALINLAGELSNNAEVRPS